MGVKRGMTAHEALAIVTDIVLIHVSTFEVKEDEHEQNKHRRHAFDFMEFD